MDSDVTRALRTLDRHNLRWKIMISRDLVDIDEGSGIPSQDYEHWLEMTDTLMEPFLDEGDWYLPELQILSLSIPVGSTIVVEPPNPENLSYPTGSNEIVFVVKSVIARTQGMTYLLVCDITD